MGSRSYPSTTKENSRDVMSSSLDNALTTPNLICERYIFHLLGNRSSSNNSLPSRYVNLHSYRVLSKASHIKRSFPVFGLRGTMSIPSTPSASAIRGSDRPFWRWRVGNAKYSKCHSTSERSFSRSKHIADSTRSCSVEDFKD